LNAELAMTTSPIVKSAIIAIFVMILVALGSAFLSLFRRRKDDDGRATVKALTVRVGLSIGLVLVIVILNALGVISPN
jgi:peptidoglycan biosynthesis protein MviN/MurJ (putative lipid II flippase)